MANNNNDGGHGAGPANAADLSMYANFKMISSPAPVTYSMFFNMSATQSMHYTPTFFQMGILDENHLAAHQEIGVFTTPYKSTILSMLSYLEETRLHERLNRIVDVTIPPMHFVAITCQMQYNWIIGDVVYEITLTNNFLDGATALIPNNRRMLMEDINWNRNDGNDDGDGENANDNGAGAGAVAGAGDGAGDDNNIRQHARRHAAIDIADPQRIFNVGEVIEFVKRASQTMGIELGDELFDGLWNMWIEERERRLNELIAMRPVRQGGQPRQQP